MVQAAGETERWVQLLLEGQAPAGKPFHGSLVLQRRSDDRLLTITMLHQRRLLGALLAGGGIVPALVAAWMGVPYELWLALAFISLGIAVYGALTARRKSWIRLEPDQVVAIPHGLEAQAIANDALISVETIDLGRTPVAELKHARGLSVLFHLTKGRRTPACHNLPDPRLALALQRALEGLLRLERTPASAALTTPPLFSWVGASYFAFAWALMALNVFVIGSPLCSMAVSERVSPAHFTLEHPANVELRATMRYSTKVQQPEAELYYQVHLRGGAEPLTLECDPFENPVWLWRDGQHPYTIAFQVVMRRCTAELDAGNYSVEARRVWRTKRADSKLSETWLSVHEPSVLSRLAAHFH